jgi:hypothetical protein
VHDVATSLERIPLNHRIVMTYPRTR